MTPDERFFFDMRGYLHLRGAMPPGEIAEVSSWMSEAETTDVRALNENRDEDMKFQLNRPVSRIIDADPRFARFLDHPIVEPYLRETLGDDYRHIDNDLYYTYPGYKGGQWHRGVKPHPTGHFVAGRFICPMVKVFWCMTDVGPGGGEFEVVPGSHKASIEIETSDRLDLPGQHVFDDVKAGDIIVFNEALLHNGRPNVTDRTRKTVIVNFGRRDAGVWQGYAYTRRLLEACTPRQREILSNADHWWQEPVLV